MSRCFFVFASLVVCMFPSVCSAQFAAAATGEIETITTADVRLAGDLDELPTGGLVGDENGGGTSLLVGINTGNVDNFALIGFDTTDPSGLLAGQTILSAEITVGVQTGFSNANHGDETNTLSIHSLFETNSVAGWMGGGAAIQNNATNVASNGVVTFQLREFNTGGAGGEWLDATGAALPNMLGSWDDTTPINTNTINGWVSGSAPTSITFEVTDQALIQRWLTDGFADIVLQVNDPDGMNTSRFNLVDGSPTLEILVSAGPACMLADVSGNGIVDFNDIPDFVDVLLMGPFQCEADCDENGVVDFNDIPFFVDILLNP